jgi:hypothetical protein
MIPVQRGGADVFMPLCADCSQWMCEWCGEPFAATRADARYCSAACKQKAYRARRASATETGG